MGDRGNIVIRDGSKSGKPSDVWFYTHWNGTTMGQTVQTALARKKRWDDSSYLARIIFCQCVKGDIGGETGWGITTSMTDNEHAILIVDVDAQAVIQCKETNDTIGAEEKRWTFAEFLEADVAEWP